MRAARPGAIETAAQAAHVQDCAPCEDAMADRLLGCLLGGAVGDQFRYAVEFDSLAVIRSRYGAQGLVTPTLTDGRLVVSDDTQMTLFTLEGLLSAGGDGDSDARREAIRRAYLGWYATQQGARPTRGGLAGCAELWARRAPGNTCLIALSKGGRGTVARPVNDSKGCGGVMRTAPIGLQRDLDAAACFLPLAAVPQVQRLLTDWPGYGETSQALARAVRLA